MDELTLELYEALEALLDLIDENVLVRNIEGDDSYPLYLSQGFHLVITLKRAQQALAKAEQQKEVGNDH